MNSDPQLLAVIVGAERGPSFLADDPFFDGDLPINAA
jgi:hypothetical protein